MDVTKQIMGNGNSTHKGIHTFVTKRQKASKFYKLPSMDEMIARKIIIKGVWIDGN